MSWQSRLYGCGVAAVLLLPCTVVLAQLEDPEPQDPLLQDHPKVAIIQYESGRLLVVREVNGDLQVQQLQQSDAADLRKYLLPVQASHSGGRLPHQEAPAETEVAEDAPLFFNPYWYDSHAVINTIPAGERGTAAARQRAAERRQQVIARRAAQGTTGIVNRAGQAYPSTAADIEEFERLARLHASADSPYATFYSLGTHLEYYRQQELAARKELALLSYDVLLDEGLRFFHERRYGLAARSFVAAAQKDQGDAGCRLHAAQALFACGLYSEALVHVRRAFELSPQLIYRPLNHRSAYTFPEDYDAHLEALIAYVHQHPDDDETTLLLAYELLFSDTPAQAATLIKRVKQMAGTDRFAWRLFRAAEPILGRS